MTNCVNQVDEVGACLCLLLGDGRLRPSDKGTTASSSVCLEESCPCSSYLEATQFSSSLYVLAPFLADVPELKLGVNESFSA